MKRTIILSLALSLQCATLPAQRIYEGVLDTIRIEKRSVCEGTSFPNIVETRQAGAVTTVSFAQACKGSSIQVELTLNLPERTPRAVETAPGEIEFETGLRLSGGALAIFSHPAAANASLRIGLPARDLDPGSGFALAGGTCREPIETAGAFAGNKAVSVQLAECFRNRRQAIYRAEDGTAYFRTWTEVQALLVKGKDASGKDSEFDSGSAGISAEISYRLSSGTPDLTVDRIEVVQVVQSPENDVPLAAGKKTVARVFVRISDKPVPDVPGVTALLRGFRDGAELPGSPLLPFNGPITAPGAPDREETNHSLNFELPPGWTGAGRLTLEATLNPERKTVEERYDNNQGSVSVEFTPTRNLALAYLRVCAGTPQRCPSPAIREMQKLAEKLYPVAEGGIRYYPFGNWRVTAGEQADPAAFVATLRKIYDLAQFPPGAGPDLLAAWTPFQAGATPAVPDPVWEQTSSEGRVAVVQDTSAQEPLEAQFLLAHELAHNFGLRHLNTPDACGASATSTDWPGNSARTAETGFDPAARTVVAKNKFDLMSYCAAPASNIWISPFSYRKLFDALAGPAQPASASEHFVVSGWASRDGAAGGLDPAYRVSGSQASLSSPTGGYCLRLLGAAGPLASYCFDLEFRDHRTGAALERERFSFKVPAPPGVVRMALMRGETELAWLEAGAPPELSITSPQAGERWTGRGTISWAASDAGGRRLKYSVLYSPDAGISWIPLATDLEETQLTVDAAELEAGSQIQFRVLAAGGLAMAVATAGPVEIEPSPRIEVSPASLDFGRVAAGSSAALRLYIDNRGNKALTLASVASDNRVFAIAGEIPVEIPPRQMRELAVRFTPASAGEVRGTLSVSGDDPENPAARVSLAGVGVAPRVESSAAGLDFGEVNVGDFKALALTLSNTGLAPLTVSSVSAGSSRFSVAGPAVPFSIAPGARQEISVRFSPNTAGAQSATLSISTNDPARPTLTVALAGTGRSTAPPQAPDVRVEVSPAVVEFGGVPVGQSRELTLSVRAIGNTAITVSSIAVDSPRFAAVSPAAPFTAAAGTAVTLRLRFTPDSAAPFRGTLTLRNNSTNQPSLAVPLTGTGLAPGTAILQVDDGSFEELLRPPEAAAELFMVNRLTPPSYPATLNKVQIYFHNRGDGPETNSWIGLLVGTAAAGAEVDGTRLRPHVVRVAETGRFNEYEVPPVTIESGDFVIGFHMRVEPGSRPAAVDSTNAPAGRGLISTDGRLFGTAGVNGVFGFRAVVTLGR